MKPTLTVVEKLYPDTNPSVASLYDKLQAVITEHCTNSPVPISRSEVIGTLEFIKAANMGAYEE